jgi:hypothetical protein
VELSVDISGGNRGPNLCRRPRLSETIALVGGDTLLGREVQDVLAESSLGDRLRLVAAEAEESGKLTEIDGAAAFLTKLEPDAVEDAAVVILAGTPKSSTEVLDAKPSGLIVDLTYVTEDDPEACVRAPLAEARRPSPWCSNVCTAPIRSRTPSSTSSSRPANAANLVSTNYSSRQ